MSVDDVIRVVALTFAVLAIKYLVVRLKARRRERPPYLDGPYLKRRSSAVPPVEKLRAEWGSWQDRHPREYLPFDWRTRRPPP